MSKPAESRRDPETTKKQRYKVGHSFERRTRVVPVEAPASSDATRTQLSFKEELED